MKAPRCAMKWRRTVWWRDWSAVRVAVDPTNETWEEFITKIMKSCKTERGPQGTDKTEDQGARKREGQKTGRSTRGTNLRRSSIKGQCDRGRLGERTVQMLETHQPNGVPRADEELLDASMARTTLTDRLLIFAAALSTCITDSYRDRCGQATFDGFLLRSVPFPCQFSCACFPFFFLVASAFSIHVLLVFLLKCS